MKKTFFAFLSVTALTLGGTLAFATVGGPTTIYDFTYNPNNESVYYKLTTAGGRGCPPELFNISLNTEARSLVFDCNQGEKHVGDVNWYLTTLTQNHKPLLPLNLKANNIAIDVVDLGVRPLFEGASEDFIYRAFRADVYQNGKKIHDFELRGCALEQPFFFAGYSVPGFNKKIMILSSAKGDCVEGGYTNESLWVVGGVDNLDKVTPSLYKRSGELVPDESTLVVYERDGVSEVSTIQDEEVTPRPTPAEPTNVKNYDTLYRILIFSAFALIVGIFFGSRLARKN